MTDLTTTEHDDEITTETDPEGRWSITRGDSLSVLADLDDEIVSAVITDPPYSSGGAFRSDRAASTTRKYSKGVESEKLPEFYGDNRTDRALLLWASLWLAEAWRVTETGGAIAMFCDWRSLPSFSDAMQVGGWTWRGVGVWAKPKHKSRPTAGGLWNDTEFILWGSKGPRTDGEYLPGLWHDVAAPDSKTRLHTTEKPQQVLRDLVRLAAPGGLVLDPFAGSGSTGIAALEADRRFMGVELSRDYHAVAHRRLATFEARGADLAQTSPGLFDA